MVFKTLINTQYSIDSVEKMINLFKKKKLYSGYVILS